MTRRPFLTRESYLPAEVRGLAAYVPEGSDVSVWGWESGGKIYGIAFAGKAERPSFHYRFRTFEDRQNAVDRLVASREGHIKLVAARKAARTSFCHTVKVGDVFRSSWGYDQTNIDFYECTAVKAKTIEIRPIASRTLEVTGWAQETVTACPGQYTGEPRTVLVTEGNAIKVRSFAHAFPWDGKPEHATSYA